MITEDRFISGMCDDLAVPLNFFKPPRLGSGHQWSSRTLSINEQNLSDTVVIKVPK